MINKIKAALKVARQEYRDAWKQVKTWYRAHREEVREWDSRPKVENAPPHANSTSTHNGTSKFSALG